jgi:hypothetical protein
LHGRLLIGCGARFFVPGYSFLPALLAAFVQTLFDAIDHPVVLRFVVGRWFLLRVFGLGHDLRLPKSLIAAGGDGSQLV